MKCIIHAVAVYMLRCRIAARQMIHDLNFVSVSTSTFTWHKMDWIKYTKARHIHLLLRPNALMCLPQLKQEHIFEFVH